MTKNNLKEFSYYLFFGLMIFAKGIGLDSGDKIYYLLSAVACVCVALKLVLTQYNKKQVVAMILLCLIAFVAYRNSGRMGIVLTTLTVVGMKDMKVHKLFHLGAVIYGISFMLTVILAGAGVITNPMVVHEKGGIGEVIRWGMGYSTGNVFHISYFILTAFLCYCWGRNYRWKKMLALMTGNILVFLFSLSYTGVVVTTFYLLLNLYAVKRQRLNKVEKIICQLVLPFSVLFSLLAPLILQYPLMQKLDHMLQARLSFSGYYLLNQPITMFGARMRDIPGFWVIMDNGYVYFLMTFGIVAFILFYVGYAIIVARMTRKQKERLPALAMIFSFLLYGIMEQFISNAFMNISLIFLGEVLFGEEAGEEVSSPIAEKWRYALNEVIKNRKYILAGSISFGAIGVVAYLSLGVSPLYVDVPIGALNYVDAQSVIVNVRNEEGTKDALNEEMNRYRELIEEDIILKNALDEAGLSDKLTENEIRFALEFSLPQSIHRSGDYHSFRIRLLELYYDVTEEEYREVLQYLMAEASERLDVIDIDNEVSGSVYSERIGKSFGEDRIEHIDIEKNYLVEKSGSIVRIEYFRNSILSALGGALAGGILIVIVDLIRYNIGKQRKIER
ncbi:O-antigen ligase family protein [Kineothrix sp. MB12-C1]|uniref:O-antigen ligase family protein n=1 Tax=Kineothrix sp. MB12-C1 TaxID=3070215 RepID=UPI0027D2FB2A|nr:hypothetical protein [Kineothrix sp. MB12-C1]WMC91695.1 hypothetical protein RBB56_12570 [Kineothrix sp. MB12-C1]